MTIKKKSFFPFLIIIIMMICELFMNSVTILKYYDEILTVFMFLYLLLLGFKGKFRVTPQIKKIIVSSIIILCIGVISNYYSNMHSSNIAILLDIVSNFKIVVIGVGFFQLLDFDKSKDICNLLTPLAKLFLNFGLIFGILSLFMDLGMRGEQRFGLWAFNFIFMHAHIYAMFILSALLLIYRKNGDKEGIKHNFYYLLISCIQLCLTTKGTSIVAAFVLVFFYYINRFNKKISIKIIIPIVIACLLFGRYQIETYFLKESPRQLFIIYGYNTAKNYFPLGSGFATYGSDMAGKYYSKLYRAYKFNNYWGMNEHDQAFLNDNYWPMMVGQFGIFGFLLGIYAVYSFCSLFMKKNTDKILKSGIMGSLFYMILASIGTTIFTTSSTIILLVIMMVASNTKFLEERK